MPYPHGSGCVKPGATLDELPTIVHKIEDEPEEFEVPSCGGCKRNDRVYATQYRSEWYCERCSHGWWCET